LFGISRLATIGDDDHHRTAPKHFGTPLFAKRVQALCNASASGEVEHLPRHGIECDIDVSKPKGIRDAGESSAENKGLRPVELLTRERTAGRFGCRAPSSR
jgi:hypothetical protein